MAIAFDFNSGASLASLGWSSISASVSNTAGAGPDGSYAMAATNAIANGSGTTYYTVNFTKRRITVIFQWNRLWWTHTSGTSLLEFLTNGTGTFNGGLVASVIELGWSNYPTTPATLTAFSDGTTANRTEASFQTTATRQPAAVANGSGFNVLRATGFPATSSGWHSVVVVLTLSSGWDATAQLATADGSFRVTVDEDVIADEQDVRIGNPILAGAGSYSVELIKIGPMGAVDDLSFTESDILPEDTSTPCCSGGASVGSSAGALPPGGDPTGPTQPWTAQCDGGGAVPTASDPTAGETWE